MLRRHLLQAGLAACGGLPALPARAQAGYPGGRPITFVVPFAAGGGGDVVARLLARELAPRLKGPVVVENRVGAGGNVGSAYVLKSRPDGYTLLNMSSSYAIQAAVSKVPYDPIADMQPIMMVSRDPGVVVVSEKSPLRSAADLFAAARANPGALTYGSAGIGSIAHLGMEELAFMMGVKFQHVPYKGSSQAFSDVLAGTCDLMFTSSTFAIPFIRSGKVRALGFSSPQRLPQMPDIPTFSEQGWQHLVVDWKAVAGPKGLPPDVIALLNRELNEVLKLKAVSDKFAAEGTTGVGGTPEQMMQVVQSDLERWRALVAKANIKIEG
ncbi:Bug family tripartite tricarboxylate transporter substrate binding protein [Ramlibacter sp. MAHUQ-53]|uniref:Bug family tripartite tricarboxylate transporter substrate binding protein n=1 Tax=unclassified Ramlibacter TaxID=2617605 RepID=UPI00362EFF8C